jgi:hypothetical protein
MTQETTRLLRQSELLLRGELVEQNESFLAMILEETQRHTTRLLEHDPISFTTL